MGGDKSQSERKSSAFEIDSATTQTAPGPSSTTKKKLRNWLKAGRRDRRRAFRKLLGKWFGLSYKLGSDKVIENFADSTSTHGLGRIHQHLSTGSYAMFVFWVGVFAVALFFCVRGIASQVQLFLSNPVTTTTHLTQITTEMPFPDLKFCLQMGYNRDKMLLAVKASGVNITLPTSQVYFTRAEVMSFIESLVGKHSESELETLAPKLAFGLDEILTSCTFSSGRCGAENFTSSFHKQSGNCFTFSTNLTQLRPGSLYGATFVFALQLHNALHTPFFLGDDSVGMRVVVGEKHTLLPNKDGIYITPGTQSYISLASQQYEDKTSHSKCRKIAAIPSTNNNNTPNTRFSPHACIEACTTAQMEQICNCTGYHCFTAETIGCASNDDTYIVALKKCGEEGGDLNGVQFERCAELCSTTKYTTQVSADEWPSVYAADSLADSFMASGKCPDTGNPQYDHAYCKNIFRTEYVKIIVGFPEFSILTLTQSNDFSSFQLLAQIGGLTGLFIGSSMLSIVEIAEVVLFFVALYFLRVKHLAKQTIMGKESVTLFTADSTNDKEHHQQQPEHSSHKHKNHSTSACVVTSV